MGILYLIQSGNYLKIGHSNNFTTRIKAYSTHNPNYKILYTREGTSSDEYFLHKILEKYLINDTEWMKYDETIINTFNNIHLNHRQPISKDKSRKSKKRKKHVQEIIKRRKILKEANTIFISKNGIKRTIK